MATTPIPAQQPATARFVAAYGLLLLSVIIAIIIAVAWFAHNIDQPTALAFLGAILTGNGLVTATQWQAAPGLASELQGLISALLTHIQALHQQQLTPALAPIVTTATLDTSTTPAAQKQGG